jgi:hypothetical protein
MGGTKTKQDQAMEKIYHTAEDKVRADNNLGKNADLDGFED